MRKTVLVSVFIAGEFAAADGESVSKLLLSSLSFSTSAAGPHISISRSSHPYQSYWGQCCLSSSYLSSSFSPPLSPLSPLSPPRHCRGERYSPDTRPFSTNVLGTNRPTKKTTTCFSRRICWHTQKQHQEEQRGEIWNRILTMKPRSR